jgi:hypothetical protein
MSSGRPPSLIVVWDTVADPDCEHHLRRIVEIIFSDAQGGVDEHTSPPQNEGVGAGDADLPSNLIPS